LEIESPEKAMAARTDNTKVSLAGPKTTSPEIAMSREIAMSSPSVAVSKTIGRYEVEGVLGRGAMGAVYLAKDPAIDRMVAIKLIQTAVQLGPSELEKYRERFYREAKAAGKLTHQGIVTVFDVGHTDEATPFIVMEYIEGQTLQEILKAKKLEREQILRLAAEILDALAFAHSKGIVHRDIKPANILVTADGAVKIMDFGIAHVVGSDMTQADDVLGSPNYMAPEQLSKGVIDARTDLFAVGIVLYRMLTGTLPFRGDSFAAIAKAVLFEDPPPPASVDPTIPSDLSAVVVRCLSKESALRFATANELKRALTSPPHDRQSDSGVVPAPTASSARESSGPPKPLDTKAMGLPGWSSKVGQAAAVTGDRSRNRRNGIRWGLAAASGLAVALFVAVRFFGGEPSATDSVPQQQETAPTTVSGPSPVSDATSTGAEVQGSDAELYHEASVAFERGELDASKAALEELLRRNPGFDGAPELLVKVNERLRGEERDPDRAGGPAPPVEPAPAPAPSEADLFYRARAAFQNGDLDGSKRQLEALLRTNPSFEGASELLVQVNDELWMKTLPVSLRAEHKHRVRGCTGTLTLAAWGIRFSSKDHEWEWKFDEIRLLERQGRWVLNLETYETEVLGLGKPKNYRFELQNPMRDEDWSRYERLAR
jgi:serine/threonine-protein kinase